MYLGDTYDDWRYKPVSLSLSNDGNKEENAHGSLRKYSMHAIIRRTLCASMK